MIMAINNTCTMLSGTHTCVAVYQQKQQNGLMNETDVHKAYCDRVYVRDDLSFLGN